MPRICRYLARAGVISLACLFLAGCAGISCKIPRDPAAVCYGDRCYIEDSTFILADQLYSKFGSIWLVERHLREAEQLLDCEVNEAIYRLRKVHGLPLP